MTDHLNYDSLRADTVRQVAKLMAAEAITALLLYLGNPLVYARN